MKILRSLFFCFSMGVAPQAAWTSDLLPDDKVPEQVQESERNPFARRGPATQTTVVEDRESEESRIRRVFERMAVSGFSDGEGQQGALVGILRLRQGGTVPAVLPNQTEKLRVDSITNEKVELVFLENEGVEENRKITLRYSLKPQVRYLLGSQVPPVPEISPLEGRFPPDKLLLPDEEQDP